MDALAEGPSGSHGERRRLAELRELFRAHGRVRVDGFVASTSRLGEVAVHAVLLSVAGVLLLARPLAAAVLAVTVLVSLLLEARRGPFLGSLYPRQRAYNLLLRKGVGAQRLLALAFVDPRRLAEAQVGRARIAVAVVGAVVLVFCGLLLGGAQVPAALRLAPALAGGGLAASLLIMARSERCEPFLGEGLERLLSLAEAQPPPDTEVVLAACAASHPRLDGLAALRDQHPEWCGPETHWLPLDPTGRAGRWLGRRGLAVASLEEARALIGYADADAVDVDRPEPGGQPVGAGDELGG